MRIDHIWLPAGVVFHQAKAQGVQHAGGRSTLTCSDGIQLEAALVRDCTGEHCVQLSLGLSMRQPKQLAVCVGHMHKAQWLVAASVLAGGQNPCGSPANSGLVSEREQWPVLVLLWLVQCSMRDEY